MTLRLLQIHAHPDDEASKASATNARYAAEGVRTVLVTCTGGEAGDILNPEMDRPEIAADLGAVRLRELAASVEILGYAASHLLGYRDSGMPDSEANKHPDAFANADFTEALERFVRIVRAERPQVLVTYSDNHGSYPHPDHIRTHEIGAAAFDAAADPVRFPDAGEPWQIQKMYYVGWTRRRVQALHGAYLARGEESPFAGWLQNGSDENDARFRTRVDVADYLGARRAALLAHRTQIAADSFFVRLPDEVLREVYPFEEFILARSLVGEPGPDEIETDLFAGLR